MKNSTSAALAWGGVLMAGTLWGGGALVAQSVIERGMSPLSLALARFALGLPLLWLAHLYMARSAPAGTATWASLPGRARIAVLGTGAAMGLSVACWFAGIAILGAALPTVISICCAPAMVTAVSVVRGYEKLSATLVAGLLLALAGVGLIVVPSGHWELPASYAAGLAFSFAAAALHAAMVLGNARMPARLSSVTSAAWGTAAAGVCIAVLALAQGITWPGDAGMWMAVTYTGVITTSVAYFLFTWSARRLAPTAASVGVLVEPLVAAVLAAWLFGDAMAPRQWAGAVLLGAAMLLLARRSAAAAALPSRPTLP
jgi:drug/metabolite transporter, DME family